MSKPRFSKKTLASKLVAEWNALQDRNGFNLNNGTAQFGEGTPAQVIVEYGRLRYIEELLDSEDLLKHLDAD